MVPGLKAQKLYSGAGFCQELISDRAYLLKKVHLVISYLSGGIITILSGPVFGAMLQQFPQLTATYPDVNSFSPNFYSGNFSPFVCHCLVFSIFASTFGPIAGFFSSGFKRAFDQKNFGCLIPGHGGVLDR